MAVKKADKSGNIVHNELNKKLNEINAQIRETERAVREGSEKLQSLKEQASDWNMLIMASSRQRNSRTPGIPIIGDDD